MNIKSYLPTLFIQKAPTSKQNEPHNKSLQPDGQRVAQLAKILTNASSNQIAAHSQSLSHYDIVSNVQNLEDAEVICLGEMHLSPYHRKNNAAIVDALYQEGDLVLEEASSDDIKQKYAPPPLPYHAGIKLSLERYLAGTQTGYIKKQISCKGWDSGPPAEYRIHLDYQKPFLQSVQKTQDAAQVLSAFLLLGTCFLDLKNDRILFLYDCGLFLAGALLLQSIKNSVNGLYDSTSPKGMRQRNQHMCQIIEQNLQSGAKKTFVIGGSRHFKCLNKTLEQIDGKAIEETMEYLKTKKFAILTPRSLWRVF